MPCTGKMTKIAAGRCFIADEASWSNQVKKTLPCSRSYYIKNKLSNEKEEK